MDIDDDYDHVDSDLEYVLENVLCEASSSDEDFKELQQAYNSSIAWQCSCEQSSAMSCAMQPECPHGGNYVAIDRELVLQKSNADKPITECNAQCSCTLSKCANRLVQNGPRKHLKIVDSQLSSKGLVTLADIPKGGFICEYAGELLTKRQALKRMEANQRLKKMNYIMFMKENLNNENSQQSAALTIVDPSAKGNIGRYLNHSCCPNCELHCVRVDCPIPKIAIFAKRNIKAGEELCFHYGGEKPSHFACCTTTDAFKLVPCLCAMENCQQFLPLNEI